MKRHSTSIRVHLALKPSFPCPSQRQNDISRFIRPFQDFFSDKGFGKNRKSGKSRGTTPRTCTTYCKRASHRSTDINIQSMHDV